MLPDYAELHCLTNFTFLRGASHPEELIQHAQQLGYRALAITDECSLSGVVRAHTKLKECNTVSGQTRLIIGSEFTLDNDVKFVLLAMDRIGYGQLCELITMARRAASKGSYCLTYEDLFDRQLDACICLWCPGRGLNTSSQIDIGDTLKQHFNDRIWIAVELLMQNTDGKWLEYSQILSGQLNLPLCASGDVHMHRRYRRSLQDTLTAIRIGRPLHRAGYALYPNGERHLRPRQRLAKIYPPELLAATCDIASQCHFSLDELHYEYPKELVPPGYTAIDWLRKLVEQGMRRRWPDRTPTKVKQLVKHELALIHELHYEPYFLTVYDIVCFARERGILCQGRGSAANSVICYCLGITEVDPARMAVLFERFISRERNEPPDIDVDFEHERREEVIQYIYHKYGRDRAALAATISTYKPRSAIRDVGKALGMSLDQVDRLAKSIHWWDRDILQSESVKKLGFTPDNPKLELLAALVNELIGFPRHLSQHVGGFVIAEGKLSQLVPIENAAMPERTVIQWEKDDLEALGLLKVDVLGLGMLAAIRKALSYISEYTGQCLSMESVPAEDPEVYRMLGKADTIGVFQIESRAQMSMLPRLKPSCYYDLVIEIAIVRPGPIQGEMVHPYLRRRNGKEPVTYPSPEVKQVLERTLGVPIFQEQVMQLSIVAAGFTPGQADQLRRSMAAWKRRGGLEKFQTKLKQGMRQRGYSSQFAEQICNQIKGFGEYGFPESHSASFALLAYVSAWLKRYHPAAFTCALLNSLPMGFYAPAQLVQDARRHGVQVLPVDVQHSEKDSKVEAQSILRLGLRRVKGLSEAAMHRIVMARKNQAFLDVQDMSYRANLDRHDLECLATADALGSLSGHRYRAFWEICGVEPPTPVLPSPQFNEGEPLLRQPSEAEDIVADYKHVGLTLRRHPLALLRRRLQQAHIYPAQVFWKLRDGATATAAGLVINRQRPGSASGVIFVTLEDESGYINVVVWPHIAESQRQPLLCAKLLAVTGVIQREEGVLHLVAGRLHDLSHWLGNLPTRSRDFH
ncbi:MAG: error-prone DNA polymerase [Arenicellales bacterium]|nr:error-prone DNA polymerase [Arenicellales bacterium]